VVRVNFFESKKSHQAGSGSGLRKPAHCTAEGKAVLAFQPAAVIDRVIAAGLERRTLRTVISSEALREELAAVAVKGYATEEQEYELGVCGVASPVRDDTGIPIAAVGITGPARRLTKARLLELAPDVDSVAKAISERLGYRSSDREGGDGAVASSPAGLNFRSLR
jgi:DNA-binding IclR family transcriptional regulator